MVVADADGAIWRSTDSGTSWHRAATGLAKVNGFSAWYTDLSCDGFNAIALSRAFCQRTVSGCGTEVLSQVRQASDRGRVWHLIARQGAADPDGGGVHTEPASALELPLDRAVAVGARGLCLLGDAFIPPASEEISCADPIGAPYHKAGQPRLPLSASNSSVVMQGAGFLNADLGWLMLDQYTGADQPRHSHARTVVWSTHDGGHTWTRVYLSRAYHGSWCNKLHTSTCWQT